MMKIKFNPEKQLFEFEVNGKFFVITDYFLESLKLLNNSHSAIIHGK